MSVTRARQLRRQSTDAERRLWRCLRNRQLDGRRFRRQAPISRYIVDFVCTDKKLVVELDGGQHAAQRRYDNARDAWLANEGYRVLRFWNNEVLENLDGVLQRVLHDLEDAEP